jgi:hypothetical protein
LHDRHHLTSLDVMSLDAPADRRWLAVPHWHHEDQRSAHRNHGAHPRSHQARLAQHVSPNPDALLSYRLAVGAI